MLRAPLLKSFAAVVVAAALFHSAQSADTASPSAWKSDLLTWRAEHAKQLQQPNGWLTLIGLEWLKPGDNSFGAAKTNAIIVHAPVSATLGVVKLDGSTVQLLPAKGGYPTGLMVDGKTPANPQALTSDSPGTPSRITSGSVSITVIHRGDRYALRIKDSRSPARLQFHGLKWFPPNEAYRVQAKWTPYNPPHQVPVPTILGTEVMSEVPGVAEFTLDGKSYKLEPILEQPDDKDLFFIFRDATAKTETYGAGRFLYTPLPDHGLAQPGEVTLDFNRAENPPCAYTPYATCPLPLPQNRLQVAIPAGQMRYHE
jgi:uncharacterized protein (DUF1684 family)